MKLIEFKFDPLPDSAQFCTDNVIYAFDEEGFIEFKAYCMINSMATPVNLEIEELGKDRYICHVLTVCELPVLSEKCILISGKMECKEVNQQLQMTARQQIIESQEQ